MAKFSIFFKDKPIQSLLFESGIIHIGREDTNNLVIASLAVAPAHAAVKINESKSVIKQLNSDFPLIINGKQQKECTLKNGDSYFKYAFVETYFLSNFFLIASSSTFAFLGSELK